MGRDHTLYAVANGKVSFTEKRMKHFDGTIKRKKLANVD
jgi:ribosomal protein L27